MSDPATPPERAAHPPGAGPLHDLLTTALRLVRTRLHDLHAALGLVVLVGAVLAGLLTAAFAWIAHWVRAGSTQQFDERVLRYVGAHRSGWVEAAMRELTFLGTATVVLTIAGVAALFLALSRQRTAAILLIWSTLGAILLNTVLKTVFDRPRPQLFTWGTHVATTSFPSGHAMSAAAIYGTVAFLAARLTPDRRVRWAIYTGAVLLIVLVASTRVYLGVHYPTDVAAGVLVGGAWAAFCTAALEASLTRGRQRRKGATAAGQPAATNRSNARS